MVEFKTKIVKNRQMHDFSHFHHYIKSYSNRLCACEFYLYIQNKLLLEFVV